MSSARINFAIIISVGPGTSDIVIDTLESVRHFYPHADLWILDDANKDGTYAKLQEWAKGHDKTHLFQNSANGGFFFLTRTLACLIEKVLQSGIDYDFVMKIDTDTLFIDGGVDELFAARFRAEGPGIVGNYYIDAFGNQRCFTKIRRKMLLDALLPFGYARKFKEVRTGPVFYADFLKQARTQGYSRGQNVFAACYAYHIETVRAWKNAGFIDALLNMKPCMVFEDDALMSVGAKAVGHKLIELEPHLNRETQKCWLEWGGDELSLSLSQIKQYQFAVLHPLKQTSAKSNSMRDYFRQLRESAIHDSGTKA